jgi:hypothetical protein
MVMPFVSYYFTDGPWRRTWVRFGYDPRIDKESRMYDPSDQVLFFGFGVDLWFLVLASVWFLLWLWFSIWF